MTYNYFTAMKEDIYTALADMENYPGINWAEYDKDSFSDYLNDELWTNDGVTGNGSGSYTMNRAKAKEMVLDNMDLAAEALRDFCVDAETIGNKFLAEDWEYLDVTIRCYLLGQVAAEVAEELDAAGKFNAEEA